jgi:transcriptional regulator with XRE-family HTH domain
VRKRPVFHEKLGRFLTALRETRGWTMRQAAELARRKGLTDLTRQVLLRIEKGQTKNPEPTTLRALAELYDQDYAALVGLYVEQQYGLSARDLSRSADDKGSGPSSEGGTAVGAAQARILEREQARAERDALVSAMQDLQKRLTDALAAHGSPGPSDTAGSSTRARTKRRRHRKAG